MAEPTPDPETVLSDQLHKKPENSRKYTMTKFGIYAILGVYVTSALLFLVKPDTAGPIVILAQIVVGAIAGLVGIFCGAQGAVDFNNASSLASVVESKKSETIERVITVRTEGGAKAFDEGLDVP